MQNTKYTEDGMQNTKYTGAGLDLESSGGHSHPDTPRSSKSEENDVEKIPLLITIV